MNLGSLHSCAKRGLAARLDAIKSLILRELANPRTISAITFEAGFGDLSYFNRAFHRRYGKARSDVRTTLKGG
jgi:AraC-like DNA-binding protein